MALHVLLLIGKNRLKTRTSRGPSKHAKTLSCQRLSRFNTATENTQKLTRTWNSRVCFTTNATNPDADAWIIYEVCRYNKKGKHLAQGPGVRTLLHAEANGALKLLRNSLLNYTIYSRTIESAETRPQKQTVSVVVSAWHSKTSNSNKKNLLPNVIKNSTPCCVRGFAAGI